MIRKNIPILLGPLVFFLINNLEFSGLSAEGQAVLATTCWIAIWWITEAVELEATSLLPLVVFPLSGGLSLSSAAESYGSPFVFLFMGGFIVGLAIQKWDLHKRIALNIISFVGTNQRKVILGFMIATAFLSMWISNTATSIMMLPIALSVMSQFDDSGAFGKNLMLGIAYSSSIGGMATLIGTPPNIVFAGVIKESFDIELSFLSWMLFALPFVVLFIFISWYYLAYFCGKLSSEGPAMEIEIEKLPRISVQEKRVLLVFAAIAFMWISRTFLIVKIIPGIDDTQIAILGAISLFLIPSGIPGQKLMDWATAKKLPWGILLIFGAGLAIAEGFSSTDLASWLGEQLLGLKAVPTLIILLLIIASVNFLTEITSNIATASMILPILAAMALSIDISPLTLMVAAILASSCAFMLPVATPPNAVVFSSGRIKIAEMVKTGFVLNLISIILIFLFVVFWWPIVFPEY